MDLLYKLALCLPQLSDIQRILLLLLASPSQLLSSSFPEPHYPTSTIQWHDTVSFTPLMLDNEAHK